MLLIYPNKVQMAPEVNLLHEGSSEPQECQIDPLAKFDKVL